jgi:exonuclease SbcC
LSSEVTTLVGASDAGKSALFRALRWLALNKPSGGGFLKHGATSCVVSLRVDSHKILRKKSSKENKYKLGKRNFTALGRTIPEEITSLLKLGEVNFQCQLDPPFWFSKSSGEVAKELNKIVNLALIDKATYSISSKIRRHKNTLLDTQERNKETQSKITSLSWLEEANKSYQELEERENALREKRENISYLSKIISNIREQEELIEKIRLPAKEVVALQESLEKLATLQDKTQGLSSLLERIGEAEEQLCQIKNQLGSAEAKATKMVEGKCPLCRQPTKNWSLL